MVYANNKKVLTRRDWIRRSGTAVSLLVAGVPGLAAGSEGSAETFTVESVRIGRVTDDNDVQVTSAIEDGDQLGVQVKYTTPTDATADVSLSNANTEQTTVTNETLAHGEGMQSTLKTAVDDFERESYEVTAAVECEGEQTTTGRELELVAEMSMNEQRNRDHCHAAVEHLRDALTVYGEAADHDGESTLLHVLPSMNVSSFDAIEELRAAKEEVRWSFNGKKTQTQWERSLTARNNIRMVRRLARLQSEVYNVYEALEAEYDAYDDPMDRYKNVIGDSEDVDELSDSQEELATFIDEWDPLIEDIETKIEQLEWQIELLEDTYAAIDLMWGTSHTVARYNLAKDDFDAIKRELEDDTAAEPEGVTDEDFIDIISDWREEADDELRSLLTG